MPKRVAKPYRFEREVERKPLTPAQERFVKKMALDRAPKELRKRHDAKEQIERFYAAPEAAMAAFALGDFQLARELAQTSLALAPSFEDNWNFGNAVHFAHNTLGLLELRLGNVSAAAEHLRASADMRGSPQLDSFGPTMQLARELSRAGRTDAVLAYFGQCRTFWSVGSTWLDIGEQKVARGAMPAFFMPR